MLSHTEKTHNGENNITPPRRWLLLFPSMMFVVTVVLSLPMMDSAMKYMIGETLWGGSVKTAILLLALFIGFFVQFLFLNKQQKFCWVLPALSVLLVLIAELLWAQGGWDRLGSWILWSLGAPAMLGSGVAILLPFLLQKNRWVQAIKVVLIAAVILTCIVFYPRNLNRKIGYSPEVKMLYYEPGGYHEWMKMREEERIVTMLENILVVPCLSPPVWNDVRGVIVRLDENYIVTARVDNTAYVYEYAGPLDRFNGEGLKWKVFRYSHLYGPIRINSSWGEDVDWDT